MKVNWKRYGVYLFRWQLSTPILWGVMIMFTGDDLTKTVLANLIGGLIFFWVDSFIFSAKALDAQWEVKEEIVCSDCGKRARGYRLVKSKNYDMSHDKQPKFRCESCSKKKSEQLKRKGIKF